MSANVTRVLVAACSSAAEDVVNALNKVSLSVKYRKLAISTSRLVIVSLFTTLYTVSSICLRNSISTES